MAGHLEGKVMVEVGVSVLMATCEKAAGVAMFSWVRSVYLKVFLLYNSSANARSLPTNALPCILQVSE